MSKHWGAPVIFFMLVLLLGVGAANSQVLDRGEVTGTITDETDAALPGVTITLTQTETGFTRVVVSNDVGRYRVPLLPVGPYTITAELAGFATLTREGVVVTVGSAPVIDITLPLASVTEAITVTADTPIVETSRAVVSTTINQMAIATLPIQGRDFRDFAELSPNVQQTPGLRSPLRFGGQQGDYSLLSVDGADMTNPFFAEYTGSLETKNFAISQEAVQEFQVLTNGFNAEFGRSTGGVVNVVTKSGTNEWRGSGFLFLRDEGLTSDDPFGNPPTKFSLQQFGGSVGGPLAQDRAFMFFAFDAQDADGPLNTQFSRSVDGVAVPEYGISDLSSLEGQSPQKQDLKSFFGRVDVDLTNNHRLTVRANFSSNNTDNFTGGRGQGQVNASVDNFEDFVNDAWSVVGSLTSVLGDSAFNEFKYHYVHEIRPRSARSDLTEVDIFDTGTFGRRFFLPINGTNLRHQFTDSFSYLFGNHDLKFGVDWNSTSITDNSFVGWSKGTYQFATLEGFEARQPIGLIQRIFYDPFSEDNFEVDGYWQHELGLFIQDKWQPKPNLTVNYGVRYEAQWNTDPKYPIAAPDGTIPMARQAPGTELMPVPQDIANDTNNFGPRFGVSWDPTGDGRTVVRGAAGLYFGRTASIFMPTGGSGFRSSVLFMFPAPPFLTFPELLPSQVVQGEPTPVPIPSPSADFVSSDFNNPRVLNVNAGVEREVAPNFSLGVDFLYSRTDNARIGGFNSTFDMNTFAPTGRDEFGRNVGIDVFARGRPDPNFFQLPMMSSLGRADYKAFTLSAKKAFANRTQFYAHYTWSKDRSNADAERDIGFNFGPQNPFDVEEDFGIDERDIRHRFVASGTVELGHGFIFSGIATFRTGLPLPAFGLNDINGDAVGGPPFDRPVDANGNLVPRFPDNQPNFYNVDIRVMWSRDFTRGASLDLLFETFNLLNNNNFQSTQFVYTLPSYGDLDTFVGNPRLAQIGIKFRFQ